MLCIVALAPPPPVSAAAFLFRPGVLVDTDTHTCFVMSTNGGIDAVDLETGATRWSTLFAHKPLLLADSLLVAQAAPPSRASLLVIIVLDASDGAQTQRVEVELPEPVNATLDSGPNAEFLLEARPHGSGAVISWRYAHHPLQGMEREADSTVAYAGASLIDLDTGAVSSAPDAAAARPPAPALPPKLQALRDAGELPRALWFSGDTVTAVARGDRTKLRRWSAVSGDSLPDVALDADGFTLRYASADERHILASRRLAAAVEGASYEWGIYELATGRCVACVPMEVPAAWFFVVGVLLVHEVQPWTQLVDGDRILHPGRIRAVDMHTGEERWTHPVRDTAYRGSLPPEGPSAGGADARPDTVQHSKQM